MTDKDDIVEEELSTDRVDAPKAVGANLYQIWVIALVGLALLGLLISLMLQAKDTSPDVIVSNVNESTEAYEMILAETQPGTRLARLTDFSQTYPSNPFAEAVRSQKEKLEAYEQVAWSEMTDVVFNVEANDITKKSAMATYENGWGNLLRAEQLTLLFPDKTDEDDTGFKPITKKSKFADGGDASGLVGAPISRDPFRPQIRIEPETIDDNRRPRIVDARIRSKKSPTYPRGAKRRKIPGLVTLSLDIDRRGRVVDTRVVSVRADRYERDFVKAAIRAAERTRFHPKTINGRPVPMRGYVQRYAFRVSR